MRSLDGAVVAITGASSGIGRAAAMAFGRRGARLVLGARSELAVSSAAAEIQALGGTALAAPLDVADAGALHEFAGKATDTFGRLDVWINNAGVGLFGPFVEVPAELHERVIAVNLLGTLHGAAAALPALLESRGVLINNACALASGAPLAASLAAAEAGIRALSISLREEYRGRGVDVCCLMPGPTASPFFEHAATLTPHAIRPHQSQLPAAVAEAMVELALHPRPELVVGSLSDTERWKRELGRQAEEAARSLARIPLEERGTGPAEGAMFEPLLGGLEPVWGLAAPRQRSEAPIRRVLAIVTGLLGAAAARRS